ncbi:ATP-binding cassette domain-containing protein [Nanoarchaeota archaeon]
MVAVIELRNVTKELGRRVILGNVSFQIEKGDIFGIIGMSGSGKTTLLNHLIGFLKPDEGDVFYQPSYVVNQEQQMKSMYHNLRNVQKIFGFAPQDPSFYPKLTIEENLKLFGSLYHLKKNAIVNNMNHLLELTQLTKHKKKLAEQLSGGMQRRLSVICSLIHNPEVLILDEPTADLDPILREETWNLIRKINKQGTTIIIASHFLDELEMVCDKVAILHEGQVIKVGGLDEIKNNYSHNNVEVHVEVDGPISHLFKFINKNDFVNFKEHQNKIIFTSTTPQNILFNLSSAMKNRQITNIKSLEVHKPSLKEIFEELEKLKK